MTAGRKREIGGRKGGDYDLRRYVFKSKGHAYGGGCK